MDFGRRRSSSSSSTSSNLSLSPTGWSPSRAAVSPPTTTTTSMTSSPSTSPECDYFSRKPDLSRRLFYLSPPILGSSLSDAPINRACAFPSWPARDSLSTTIVDMAASASNEFVHHIPRYSPPSSRISDTDLEELEFSSPGLDMDALGEGGGPGISWSAVGNGNVVLAEPQERKRRLPPPPVQVRRRSSSRGTKRKAKTVGLGAIAE